MTKIQITQKEYYKRISRNDRRVIKECNGFGGYHYFVIIKKV
jgi:hypothetical protein